MNTLLDPTDRADIVRRIKQLTPSAQRRWGTMTVGAALAPGRNILGIVKLPQAPNAFYGYVSAPEDRAGYQIVVLFPNESPESQFWLTQGAHRRLCAGHV